MRPRIFSSGGGVLCEPNDAKSLADGIEPLMLDPRRAQSQGEAGRRAVRERYSVEAVADEVVKACAGLVLGK